MKFLCLCYYDTDAFAKLTAEEAAKIAPACKPHDEKLMATGKVAIVGSLAFPDQWAFFVPGRGEQAGPYAKTSKQAGAFLIVEAKDMEEAKKVASLHPAANFGEHLGFAVEVRPCETYEQN